MKTLKLAIVLGFALMFFAGLAVGRSKAPVLPVAAHVEPPKVGIEKDLDLSADQRDKIKKIWDEAGAQAAAQRNEFAQQFHDLDSQRDLALRQMMSDEEWVQYQQILHEHDARVDAVRARTDKPFRDAEQKTRALLTPEQQARYDQMLKDRRHHGGPPGGRWHPRPTTPPGPQTAPTS